MDADVRVAPKKSPLKFRRVKISGLINDFRPFACHIEPMGESGWNPGLDFIFRREYGSFPLAECRRTPPEIHADIEDFADDNAHQLSLRPLDLVMQPSKSKTPRFRMAVLDELRLNSIGLESPPVIGFHEISAFIDKDIRGNQKNIRDLTRPDIQESLAADSY